MRLLVNLFLQVEAMGDWRYSELHCVYVLGAAHRHWSLLDLPQLNLLLFQLVSRII